MLDGVYDRLDEKLVASEDFDILDFAIFTDQPETVVDHCWFRGGWFDPLTIAWETIRNGNMKSTEPGESGAPGASLFVPFQLQPKEEKTIRLMMVWYVPNSDIRMGEDSKVEEKCDPASGCCNTTSELGMGDSEKPFTGANYKPWYANKFWDVYKAATYFQKNYDDKALDRFWADILNAGRTHPFPIWRVSEILKWVESGEYQKLMDTEPQAMAA